MRRFNAPESFEDNNLWDEAELDAKYVLCEKCDHYYIEDFTSCACVDKTIELIDGMKPIDWALKQLEKK